MPARNCAGVYAQKSGRLDRGQRKEFVLSRLRAKSMFLFAPIRERNVLFEGLTAPFAVKLRGGNCFLEDGRLTYPAIRSPGETADILRAGLKTFTTGNRHGRQNKKTARRSRSSGERQTVYGLSSSFFGSVQTMRPLTLMPSWITRS